MDARSLKTSFLLQNFSLFVERLSYTFPFERDLLAQFSHIWRWDLMSFNEHMKWSLEMMLEFEELLDFGNGDAETETKWINLNRAIPWSCEILEAFEDRLQWRELSVNRKVSGNLDIRVQFYHKLLPYLNAELHDEYEETFDKESLHFDDELSQLDWMLNDIEGFTEFAELNWHTIEEIENGTDINWTKLSQNQYLPWSKELIERHIDHWDWACLSVNEYLPWSEELIDKFLNYWHWGGLGPANEFGDRQILWGLTSNEHIFWEKKMLYKYRECHDWFHLSYLGNTDWDIDSLVVLQDYLSEDQLLFNESIWTKVFSDMINEEGIKRIVHLFLLLDRISLN